MTHYVHHIPGRMRIKSPSLKRNNGRASQVKSLLDSVHGVLSHEVNPVTGSILVHYDRDLVCAHNIMSSLTEAGHVHAEAASRLAPPASPGTAAVVSGRTLYNATGAVGKAVVGVVVEKIVERSAFALVGALL